MLGLLVPGVGMGGGTAGAPPAGGDLPMKTQQGAGQ